MQTINDRIEAIIAQSFGGNKSAFAKAIGYKPQIMSTYLGTTRRSKPSIDMVAAILNNTNVDARWLILGGDDSTNSSAASNVSVTGHHNNTAVDGTLTITTGDAERVATLEQLVATQQKYITMLEQQLDVLRGSARATGVQAPASP